jgi:hypothetical protein
LELDGLERLGGDIVFAFQAVASGRYKTEAPIVVRVPRDDNPFITTFPALLKAGSDQERSDARRIALNNFFRMCRNMMASATQSELHCYNFAGSDTGFDPIRLCQLQPAAETATINWFRFLLPGGLAAAEGG